jgi:hypothetical protein
MGLLSPEVVFLLVVRLELVRERLVAPVPDSE